MARWRHYKAPEYFSISIARSAQRYIASLVIEEDLFEYPPKTVGGADLSYHDGYAYASIAVLDFQGMNTLEYVTCKCDVSFPYIPTLLAFREAGPIIECFENLKLKPDILIIDGQGRLHPYRCGLACHVGVALDIPCIGVAKKKLCGTVSSEGGERFRYVVDRGEVIGAEVYSKLGVKPIYVSVGHKITLNTAIKIVLDCCRGHRLPEPIRVAHSIVTRASKSAK